MSLLFQRRVAGTALNASISFRSSSFGRLPRIYLVNQRGSKQPSSCQAREPILLHQRACFSTATGKGQQQAPTSDRSSSVIDLTVNGKPTPFLPMLLRDLCDCPYCKDPSTNQKYFSSAQIPSDISVREVKTNGDGVDIRWQSDIAGLGDDHVTHLSFDVLSSYANHGTPQVPDSRKGQICWSAQEFNSLEDIDYESYMTNDETLLQALRQLHTHGLVFLTNVPESESSVSTLGERIGAIKNTFYGYTWDVRSVPEAKNVAYTAQDLGFHMDLLYMKQPPHLQLLHCIRSSAAGGASLFTDSYKAARDLFHASREEFDTLAEVDVDFHYNHPSSHLYHQNRPVFEMNDSWRHPSTSALENKNPDIVSQLKAVSWSPPFQAPFQMHQKASKSPLESLNSRLRRWHSAAQRFSSLVHRKEDVYERMMKPGECVLFDNRRVLHARSAFEVGDIGKERWLRGTYLDKDPYVSKLRVLGKKFA